MKRLLFQKQSAVPVAEKPMPSLAACLLMDFLGYATYGIPFLGEFLDIVWAPISALVFMRMFGGAKGFFGGVFNFIEEIMPGLDFIPTFTIAWFVQYSRRKKSSTVSMKPVVIRQPHPPGRVACQAQQIAPQIPAQFFHMYYPSPSALPGTGCTSSALPLYQRLRAQQG